MIEFKTLLTEIGNTTNGYDFEFVSSISDMYRYEFTTKNDLDYTVLFEPISSGEYLKKVYIDFNPALMDIIEDNEDDVYEVTFNVDDLFRKDTWNMTQRFDSIKVLVTIKNIIDDFYLRVPKVFALHVEGIQDPGAIKNKRFSIYSKTLPKFFKGWKFLINKRDESLIMIAPTQMDKLGDLWRK